MADKLVYDFHEGNRDMKDLLGGKGANLAEMTNLGLPVPPGFTITTDAYRRFVQMFGKIVLGIDPDRFEHLLEEAKEAKGEGAKDTDLDAGDLRDLTSRFKAVVRQETGEDFPAEPGVQLEKAIEAVFKSWNTPRA